MSYAGFALNYGISLIELVDNYKTTLPYLCHRFENVSMSTRCLPYSDVSVICRVGLSTHKFEHDPVLLSLFGYRY